MSDDKDQQDQKDDKTEITSEQFSALQSQLEETNAELERFKAKHAEAEKHRKQAEKDAQTKAEEAARKAGDTEALERSWEKKFTAREQELLEQVETRDKWLRDITVNKTAEAISGQLAIEGSDSVLVDHVAKRLGMDLRDSGPVTVVLDSDGKPSALTVDELKTEFSENPAFAPLIRGSKSSGSGGINGKGGAHKGLKRSEMSTKQKAAYIDEHGNDAYDKLPY